jgi:ribosome-binding factor A
MEQIDSLIHRELAFEIRGYFPDDIITITQVHVTKDLSYAKVWITSPISSEKALKKCQKIAPELRKHLAKKIVARKVPSLHFVIDETFERASRINELIGEIKKEK